MFDICRVILFSIFISIMSMLPTLAGEKVLLDGLPSADVTARGVVEVFNPTDYDHGKPKPLPLVVLLHGFGANGTTQNRIMGFSDHIDKGGFLLVHPNGIKGHKVGLTGLIRPRFWNATHACCQQFGPPVDDETFLFWLIKAIDDDARLAVDPSRIYLIGHSNGAKMAHRLACKAPELFAGIVTIAGTTYRDPAECKTAAGKLPSMNVLHIHGTDDEVISYDGGTTIRMPKNLFPFSPEISLGQGREYPGAVQTAQAWAKLNGCSDAKLPGSPSLDLVVGNGPETEVFVFDCTSYPGRSVHLWKMLRAAHIPKFSSDFSRLVLEHLQLLK